MIIKTVACAEAVFAFLMLLLSVRIRESEKVKKLRKEQQLFFLLSKFRIIYETIMFRTCLGGQ